MNLNIIMLSKKKHAWLNAHNIIVFISIWKIPTSLNWQKAEEQLMTLDIGKTAHVSGTLRDHRLVHHVIPWGNGYFKTHQIAQFCKMSRRELKKTDIWKLKFKSTLTSQGSSVKTFSFYKHRRGRIGTNCKWAPGSHGEKKSSLLVNRDRPVLNLLSSWDLCMHLSSLEGFFLFSYTQHL